jgi:tetratricopeptide (TPR) repeat protein
MSRSTLARLFLSALLWTAPAFAQLEKITIPAGTPEDKALQEIANEPDAQKKLALYEHFVRQFSANPMAVAYGNWQISQYYQSSGDLEKALSYGDKALAARPDDLDLLVSQTNIAVEMKDNGKIVLYACRGGQAYHTGLQQPKPTGVSDAEYKSRLAEAKESNKSSYEFLETAAFNTIVDEKDAQTRITYIERFTPAFPASRFEEQVTQYATFTFGQLNDPARLFVYGEKALAANPNSIPTLLLLANAYVDDTLPSSLGKAITYAQKVIELAKAEAPDADKSRRISGGVAHSTLGYAYTKQDKIPDAIPELQSAAGLLKGQDNLAYATALYRLGWAYAKTNQIAEAKMVLEEAVTIPSPLQTASRDLLNKVNAAPRPKAKKK